MWGENREEVTGEGRGIMTRSDFFNKVATALIAAPSAPPPDPFLIGVAMVARWTFLTPIGDAVTANLVASPKTRWPQRNRRRRR